jgi:TusA-related sulfurtransferase
MKEITLETKVADLINNYEGMKDFLIEINPKFEKLNNPILLRTIAKVAGVKQAAIVGGMEPMELLNRLREFVGQSQLDVKDDVLKEEEAPSWIAQEPKIVLDANAMLNEDKNPLVELHQALKKIDKGEVLILSSDFRPEPLIEEFSKKGHKLYCQEINDEAFMTYVMV